MVKILGAEFLPAFGRQVFCCLEDDDKQNGSEGQSCLEKDHFRDIY